MLTEKNLTTFLDLLAAKKSVPGGGGVAALTASLAAALTSMVCNFTIGKAGYAEVTEEIKTVLSRAENLRKELTELIDLDAKVFDELMSVYRMPKVTEQQKIEREEALEAKAKKAASVPMAVMRLSVKVSELALLTLQKGNRDLASDAVMSGILGHAALRSAHYNVVINLKMIKNTQYIVEIKQELADLFDQSNALEKQITALSDEYFEI